MNEEEKKAIEDMNRFANGIDMNCVTARQMQIILNLIEKLQKENEELNYKLHSKKIALEIYNRYIPKSKLKDIIDRIDYDIKKTKEIISNNSNIYTSDRKNDYQIVRLRAMNTKSLDIKERLQDLIKERKEEHNGK